MVKTERQSMMQQRRVINTNQPEMFNEINPLVRPAVWSSAFSPQSECNIHNIPTGKILLVEISCLENDQDDV